MFKQVRFCRVILAIFCTGLIIGTIGCGTDDDMPIEEKVKVEEEVNPLVGTWQLKTFDGESVQSLTEAVEERLESYEETDVDFSYSDIWTFNNDGTWYRDMTMVLDVAALYKIMGTYSLSETDYTLKMTSFQSPITGDDNWIGVVDEDFEESNHTVENGVPVYVDTGTWSIDGDTLTLTSDTGQVYGFKKE